MKIANIHSPVAGCMRWGVWGANFSISGYRHMIDTCIENGINCFDHADIYGDYTTEAEFGEALQENPSLRDQVKLISKCGIQLLSVNRPSHLIKSYNTTRQHITSSVENSLQNFGTDYLDVLLIHRPDSLLHPEEVAETIAGLKQQGKILSFGVSNFLPFQTDLLSAFTEIDYNQIELSLLQRRAFSDGSLENCMKHRIVPMAWSPLGGGKFSDETHPRYRSIVHTASAIAIKYDTGINEVLLAWLHTHPSGILTIIGTTKIERLVQAKIASGIRLEREDWYALLEAVTGEEID